MPNCPAILKDLIIIATLVGLVAEEVDGGKLDTTERLLCLQVLQAECFVPASGKHIKGNLSADREATIISINRCQ